MNTMRNVRELEAKLGIDRSETKHDDPDVLMTMRNVRALEAKLGIDRPETKYDDPDVLMPMLRAVEKIVGMPEVTPDHITRARRMIGCGLDEEEVSQWLANDDALRDKIKKLEERVKELEEG